MRSDVDQSVSSLQCSDLVVTFDFVAIACFNSPTVTFNVATCTSIGNLLLGLPPRGFMVIVTMVVDVGEIDKVKRQKCTPEPGQRLASTPSSRGHNLVVSTKPYVFAGTLFSLTWYTLRHSVRSLTQPFILSDQCVL